MKAQLISGNGKKEIELPPVFSARIREDIAQKFYEAQKEIQPYAPGLESGKHHSASGILSHSRRLWKTAYGKGISRVPRKIMWRRGDHFYWVGAETSGTRGGRQAHPPRVEHFQRTLKINKKEMILAVQSAIAATASSEFFNKRYSSIDKKISVPFVIESESLKMKAKEFFNFIEKSLGDVWNLALQEKRQRAGKGKLRNRRYKKSAGLLLVIGAKEKAKIPGIDIRRVDELEIADLWPMGRLTVYSEEAIKELGKIGK